MVDQDGCAICLEEIKEPPNISLECNHKFHDECIREWADKSGQVTYVVHQGQNQQTIVWECPLCRLKIREVTHASSDESVNIRSVSYTHLTLPTKA